MLKLYDSPRSGNCHKVRLFLSLLNIDHEVVTVNMADMEQKTPEHLARHPLGKIPVIDDYGTIIWDSQAILVYLAQKFDGGSDWYPRDIEGQAAVQSWLAFAALEIMIGPTFARGAVKMGRPFDLDAAQASANASFKVLDDWLSTRDWLACDRPTIADVAVYPYCGLAWEGDLDTDAYPNMTAWFRRIEGLPGYKGMESLPKP